MEDDLEVDDIDQGPDFTNLNEMIKCIYENRNTEFKCFFEKIVNPDFYFLTRVVDPIIQAENRELIEYLIQKGVNLSQNLICGVTPLYYVTGDGSPEFWEFLIANGAENNENNNFLHIACAHGNYRMVRHLIKYIDSSNSVMETPIFSACRSDELYIVKFLILHGANYNRMNKFKQTPLDIAYYCGCISVVKYLEKIKAKKNKKFSASSSVENKVECVCLSYKNGGNISVIENGNRVRINVIENIFQDIVDILGIFRVSGVVGKIIREIFPVTEKEFSFLMNLMIRIKSGRLVFGKILDSGKIPIIENVFLTGEK